MKDKEQNKDFQIKISILHKLMIPMVMLVFVATGASTYVGVKEESKVLTSGLIHRAKRITMHVASSAKSSFRSLNWIFVEQELQDIGRREAHEVVFAKLVKPNGEVYLADKRSYYGDKIDSALLFDKETLLENFSLQEIQEKGMLLVHPVNIGNKKWHVLLGVSLRSVRKAIEELIIRNVLWGSSILLLVTIGAFFLSKSISGPLVSLSRSAGVIAEGNLEHTVSVKSKDEVGHLSHAFTRMMEKLKGLLTELETSEERHRTLVATASKARIGIALIQREGEEGGIFKYANQYLADLAGYSREELIGMPIRDIIHSASLSKMQGWCTKKPSQDDLQKIHQSGVINKKGKEIPIEISIGTTTFEGRKALVCYLTNITEKLDAEKKLKRYSKDLEKMVKKRTAELEQAFMDLKKAQSQLIHSEKLASIGQLAAGIAHEINTPTQYAGDNVRFLRDAFNDLGTLFKKYVQLPEALKEGVAAQELVREVKSTIEEADLDYLKDEIPRAIEQTLEGMERISGIVRSMKEFSHPGVKEKTAVDINRAIENTITVSRNEWKYVAEIETDLDPSLPLVPCLPGELNQVFLNLIINAAQAIGDVAGDGSDGKGLIRISTCKDGGYVEIRFSDTGPGIPEEIQTKIFDPFFTTKEVGTGTGQGLAISRSVILEKHGGDLSFETESGKGTTFVIRLPVKEEAA